MLSHSNAKATTVHHTQGCLMSVRTGDRSEVVPDPSGSRRLQNWRRPKRMASHRRGEEHCHQPHENNPGCRQGRRPD